MSEPRYMVKCSKCGQLLDIDGDRIHVCPMMSDAVTTPTDDDIRACLPSDMAAFVIRQRARIDKLGRTFGPIGAQTSWLVIVEELAAERLGCQERIMHRSRKAMHTGGGRVTVVEVVDVEEEVED